jgi:hypothetical protein
MKVENIASNRTSICTLVLPPIHISVCQGKTVKSFLDFVFGGQSHIQYLAMKIRYQKVIIYLPDMEVLNFKKTFSSI